MSNPRQKVSLGQYSDPDKYKTILNRAEQRQSHASSSEIFEHQPLMPPADWPIERKLIHGKIVAVLKTIYDPEIPVDIYELGLIYTIDITPENKVTIRMTLTAPGCPVADQLVREVGAKAESIPEITEANVELVWDPPWSKDRMSEAARMSLGL